MFGESSYCYFRRKSVQTIAHGLARIVLVTEILGLILIYRSRSLANAAQFHLILSYLALFFSVIGNYAFSFKVDDEHSESSPFNPDQIPFLKKYFTHLFFPAAGQFAAALLMGLSGIGIILGGTSLLFGWGLNAVLFFVHVLASMMILVKLDPVTHVYRKAARGKESHYLEAVQIEEVKSICLEMAKLRESSTMASIKLSR